MKTISKLGKRILQTLVLTLILLNLFIILSGRFYLYKGIYNTYLHGRSGPHIYDRDIFPYRTIKNADKVFKWEKMNPLVKLNQSEIDYLEHTESASFLVFKNDTLISENYWNGHKKETASNSFSAAKTFVALLIGAAVGDGKITSLDESVGKYIPEFANSENKKITIRHLLMMASGLDWDESVKSPLSDNAESYYGSDLRTLATKQKLITTPGKLFNYQSGNSQLLGFIIEKATGKKLSEYAYEKLWSKIGTEHEAFWTMDKENGYEKSFCCFYATSEDFARVGKLILQNGAWNGKQLIPTSFMKEFFENPKMKTDEGVENYRYGLHIWTYLGGDSPIYYCRGILGQYIISIPSENIIIVRTGSKRLPDILKSENKFKIGHPIDLFEYLKIAKRLAEN
jgi:CubicO group peptidase (beta-lactamase class C family)